MRTKMAGRAVLLGAMLGAWLGFLTGVVLGLGVATLHLLVVGGAGLLTGAAAGAVIGLLAHAALDSRPEKAEEAADFGLGTAEEGARVALDSRRPEAGRAVDERLASRRCRSTAGMRRARRAGRPDSRPVTPLPAPGPSGRRRRATVTFKARSR